MKAASLLPLISAALVIASSSARSQEPPREIKDALSSLETCYMTHAKIDGGMSCQAPPALVGAVFGACTTEEGKFKGAVQHAYSADYEMATGQLEKLHARSTGAIQDVILSAQSKIRKCP
jgi:hypothetical protein